MLKKVTVPLVILAIAIAIVYFLKITQPKTEAKPQVEKSWLIEAIQVEYQTVSPEITVYGRVETPRFANINAALEADVIGVYALEGDNIHVGDTLIELDDIDAELLVQQRRAAVDEAIALIESEKKRQTLDQSLLKDQKKLVDYAKNAVERSKKLEQSRLTSQANLDNALASYSREILSVKRLEHDINEYPVRLARLTAAKERALALLEESETNLQRSIIKAPFTGRVAKLNVSLGDRVRVGDNLVSVYDLSDLEVRAQIPARYIFRIRNMLAQGQTVNATANLGDEVVKLELKRLSGEVRLDSGGVDGLFLIKNNDEPLPIGTFVQLQVQLEPQSNVFVLPYSALYGLNNVYRVQGDYLQSVNIERVGEVKQKQQHALLVKSEKLKPGDWVATTQLPNAMTGLRVEVVQ